MLDVKLQICVGVYLREAQMTAGDTLVLRAKGLLTFVSVPYEWPCDEAFSIPFRKILYSTTAS